MDIVLSPFRGLAISDDETALYNLEHTEFSGLTASDENKPLDNTKTRSIYQYQNELDVQRTPRRSRKSINRDLDFQIYEDPGVPKAEGQYRSFYGSNVPVLRERGSGQKAAKYQKIHDLSRYAEAIKGLDELYGDWLELGLDMELLDALLKYDVKLFAERVRGFYEWTYLEEPNDIWLWVSAKGYHRRWTLSQCFGFCGMLQEMNDMVKKTVKVNKLRGTAPEDAVCPFVRGRLQQLGITNISVENAMRYIYRFCPCAEDRPLHRRVDFTQSEAYWVDWKFPEYWLDGEGRKLSDAENTGVNVEDIQRAWVVEFKAFLKVGRHKAQIIENEG